MSTGRFNPATLVILLLIVVVAALRTWFNIDGMKVGDLSLAMFSPVGAIAMFGGAYFNKGWKAFLFPLGVMLISDLILQATVYAQWSSGFLYEGWYWVYGAIALMVVASRLIMKHVNVGTFLISVIVITFIHWIVADLGYWQGTGPKSWAGFYGYLVAAIPFEWRFLAASAAWGALLFGGYAYIQSRYPALKEQHA